MEVSSIINNRKLLLCLALALIGISFRLLPHEANFAPIAAIALLSGALLGTRYALLTVMSTMVVSDLIIGTYSSMLFTWLAFLAIALYGTLFHKASFGKRVIFGSLGSAIIFFIVSNFGVWVSSGMYSHTFAGLVECFYMAIPFLRATLLSDLMYSGLLFGAAAWVAAPHLKPQLKVNNQYQH